MPTEAGNGNGAEVHFLPTTSAFLFNSAEAASGGVHDGNDGLAAAFIRWGELVRERSHRALESCRYRQNRKRDYGPSTATIRS